MSAPCAGAGLSRAHPIYERDRPMRTPRNKNNAAGILDPDADNGSPRADLTGSWKASRGSCRSLERPLPTVDTPPRGRHASTQLTHSDSLSESPPRTVLWLSGVHHHRINPVRPRAPGHRIPKTSPAYPRCTGKPSSGSKHSATNSGWMTATITFCRRPRDGRGPNESLTDPLLGASSATDSPGSVRKGSSGRSSATAGLSATEIHWDNRPSGADYVILADPGGTDSCVVDATPDG